CGRQRWYGIRLKRKHGLLHLQKIVFLAMDILFLETFLAVVDRGSMAEVARRLNLTPAAVAQRLRALETEMGIALVVRSGHTVRPTDAGAAIVERVRKLVKDARDVKSLATSDVPAGELRLGAIAP